MEQDKKLDLLEFARTVKDGSDLREEEFVELMRRVLPLASLRNLTPEESEWLFMTISWLHDYSLLLWEFHQAEVGSSVIHEGHPFVPGSNGPFITNMLTRGDEEPDFSQLEDFGVGRN